MATLKNVTINDTGYDRITQGSTGQRPTVPTVTINSGISGGLSIARDGLQLWIPYSSSSLWNVFQGLPDYLKGLQCTISINDGTGSFTFSTTTRVYQLWNTSWSTPSTGLLANTVETGKQYVSSYSSINIYYQDYTAGTYNINNTSAMYFFSPLAAGTTTAAGAMRYNTTTGYNEVWNGAEWRTLNGVVASATGGTIQGAVSAGGYKIHTFTSNGTFTPLYSGPVDLLIVAGGGGGAGLGGGGGGGGFVYQSNVQVVGGYAYPIQVGTGGNGSTTHSPGGNVSGGNPSYFGTSGPGGIIATGGGYGGHWTGAAGPGGSGGGGPGHNGSPGQRPAGAGIHGQGHPGGYGHHGGGPASNLAPQPGICIYGGGGGGGAGQQGFERKSYNSEAKGGDGMASSIQGTAQAYYGAGGGGGAHGPPGNYGRDTAIGGLGGGGWSQFGSNTPTQNGQGYGSGGAGNTHGGGPDTSGAGSQGIVIVRYRT